LVSNVVRQSYSIRSGSSRVLLGAVTRKMPRLFAIGAESFLQVLTSFFVSHGVDGGGDDADVHSIRVSVRGCLCVAPRALISLLDCLSEVSVSVVVIVVVASAVFSLCGSSVLVDLVILDGFGKPSVFVDSSSCRFSIFESVRFVNVSQDFHSEGWVQDSSEHSYSKRRVINNFCLCFQDSKLIDNFLCCSSILFHGFEFPEGLFDFVFFSKVVPEILDEVFDLGPFVGPICLFDICINVEFFPRFCFSSIYVGEKELGFRSVVGEVFHIGVDIDVTVSKEFFKGLLVAIEDGGFSCM